MIFQQLSREEIIQLKDELQKDLPGSAKMFYILSNYLCGLLDGFEVLVDHWPDWTCVVLRPQSATAVPSYFRHYYICHTKSVKAFRFFIQRPCVVDWSKPVCFTGVPYDAIPTLQEQCRKHGGQLSSVENRYMYAWTHSEPPTLPQLPDGLMLTTLRPQDASNLVERWKNFRPDPAIDLYMKEVATRFDSSAIVNDKGELMAYIGMQFNGAMAMLHVEPQHRGQGLGQIVLKDLTRKLLSKGKIVYGLIPTEDSSFLATSSNHLGFTWVPGGSMAWVRYQPKASPTPQRPSLLDSQKALASAGSLSCPCTEGEGEQTETGENVDQSMVFLTALPLSCNECADISTDGVAKASSIAIGIS